MLAIKVYYRKWGMNKLILGLQLEPVCVLLHLPSLIQYDCGRGSTLRKNNFKINIVISCRY